MGVLGERLNGIQEVSGSIPLCSTKNLVAFCNEIFYPSQEAWYIINSQGELYLITPQGVYFVSLMICKISF